jgi:uncharacterized protein (UPF0333 family)
MSKTSKSLLIILLLATNLLWSVAYVIQKNTLKETKASLEAVNQNKKVASFHKLFVDKVLMSEGVVDFNTRVTLQNSVNDIKDDAITNAWSNFLSSKTEEEGQTRVKELLALLTSKVYNE